MHRYLPKSRIARITASLSALASVALLAAVAWTVWLDTDPRSGAGGGASVDRAIGGPFELTDTQGRTVTHRDLRGDYSLVFFGYTHCPDVCPATLSNISQALDVLADEQPAKAKAVTPVFITIDPARDDVERMRDYIANFHPRMIGLTGDAAAIQQAADAYHVAYKKVDPDSVQAAADGRGDAMPAGHGETEGAAAPGPENAEPDDSGAETDGGAAGHAAMDHGAYLMQHSSYIFLMGPEGRHIDHVASSAGAPRIAALLRDHVTP